MLRMHSKRERKQGDSVPYTVEISSVDQIRCCRYLTIQTARPKRDAYEIHSLGRKQNGEFEKEPEASWDSRGEICYDQ